MKTESDMSHDNFCDAQKGEIRALLAPPEKNFDLPITKNSEFWQRECCVQIRRYLGLECSYGMRMDANGWDETTQIWPITQTSYSHQEYESGIETLIGAVCFEKVEYSDIGMIWSLEFCWIHPFHRSKGLLRKHWNHFESCYGKFAVGHPWSNAMKSFLQKIGYPTDKDAYIARLSQTADKSEE